MKNFKLNKASLGEFVRLCTELVFNNKDYRVSIVEWREKRSLDANAQYYAWMPVIAKHYGEDVKYITKWMKHDIAWPILERDGGDYAKKVRFILTKTGYNEFNHEQRVELIDMFAITSMMNSKQHTGLRDELQVYWAKNGLNLEYWNKK